MYFLIWAHYNNSYSLALISIKKLTIFATAKCTVKRFNFVHYNHLLPWIFVLTSQFRGPFVGIANHKMVIRETVCI